MIMIVIAFTILMFQSRSIIYGKYILPISPAKKASVLSGSYVVHRVDHHNTNTSDLETTNMYDYEEVNGEDAGDDLELDDVTKRNIDQSLRNELKLESIAAPKNSLGVNRTIKNYGKEVSKDSVVELDANSITPPSLVKRNKQFVETLPVNKHTYLFKNVPSPYKSNSTSIGHLTMRGRRRGRRREQEPMLVSEMNSLLLQSIASSRPMKPRWSSARDRELLSAKLQINNAPAIRSTPELYGSVFRNISIFKRSYELMESILKVYIYKEGEKPIFHQPNLRGIYASEGWFIKLMEGNKQFVVRDPRKAHLFFLPFSSQILRTILYKDSSSSWKNLEKYLKNYLDLIRGKYRFWDRTDGADHFLVGCHDWALKLTRNHMSKCIRALCNSNIAKGFKIGKDVTLPVTAIRSAENPIKDLGGNPPSKRPLLAFFAGSMHGDLRPMLLHHWENKEADMKIVGSMPRDLKGKETYRENMRSSKYCICAKGYEVHTPRVVEAIFYECVPVIISDNYVPPFFEMLNWEAFSVFVLEKDIPNLRNILLSITDEKYIEMQKRVKMVQRHFLWHKKPVKYDLFHMILHSVWYNRISQVKPR